MFSRRGQVRARAIRLGVRWGVAAAFGAAVSFATYFARRVLTPAKLPESGVEVLAIEEVSEASVSESAKAPGSPSRKRVWLQGPDVELSGSYSFIFDVESRETQHLAGHARLGPVVATVGSGRHAKVSREVLSEERGELRVGARGRITGWWFVEPEQLGYDVKLVSLPMPDGVSWGWVIAPEGEPTGEWAVHVHGRGALPHETLRGVRPFAEAGITSLVIAYRNDAGAPAGRRGRYGLGLAEQFDVDAAVGWAREQGATSVTLVGWSMGATACLLAANNGENAGLVNGLVLDSPALDWPGLLRRQARLANAPAFIAEIGVLLLQCGVVRGAVPGQRATDLSMLTPARLISQLRVPMLIHASPDDTFVPWQGALRAAQLKSRLVRLHPSRGEHVKLWNVDPKSWEQETSLFIKSLAASA